MGLLDPPAAPLASAQFHRLLSRLRENNDSFSIICYGDSTGDARPDEWFYLWSVALAARYPAYTANWFHWNGGSYDAATVLQTGTGTGNAGGPWVLNIYGASQAGVTFDYIEGKWQAMIEAPNQTAQTELVFINQGHNEGGTSDLQTWPRLATACEAIAQRMPRASIIICAQNPETGNIFQQTRANTYRQYAAMRGFGFIDAHRAFMDYNNVKSPITGAAYGANGYKYLIHTADGGVHPIQEPAGAYGSTTTTGATSANAATINVASTSSFGTTDGWLVAPDGTVFSYTAYTSTSFTGCVGAPALASGVTLSQFSPSGQKVWRDEVLRSMQLQIGAIPRGGQPDSSFAQAGQELLTNGKFTTYPLGVEWTNTNCTITQNTTAGQWETKKGGTGYAVRLQSASAAPAYIEQTIPIELVKGKTITYAVRLRQAAAMTTSQGRAYIINNITGTASSRGSSNALLAYHWEAMTAFIPIQATSVTVRIYCDSASTGTADISVDRACLTFGALPKDLNLPV